MGVEWTESGLGDLESILTHIAADDTQTATDVGRRIWAAAQRLAAFPNIGRPGRRAGTRELVLPSLPFVIVYTVRAERTIVLRVLHTARMWP